MAIIPGLHRCSSSCTRAGTSIHKASPNRSLHPKCATLPVEPACMPYCKIAELPVSVFVQAFAGRTRDLVGKVVEGLREQVITIARCELGRILDGAAL